MTRYEIISMATEAGIPQGNLLALSHGRLETGAELLERFAALVAAKEREACAALCESRHENGNYKYDHRDECAQAIREKGETK